MVDLRLWLPQQATFRFSGSTGNASAGHFVTAWNLSLTLEITRPAQGRHHQARVLFPRQEEAEEEADESLQYMSGELGMESTGPEKFSYSELASAACNFKAEKKLGECGFRGVYRGFLQSTGSMMRSRGY